MPIPRYADRMSEIRGSNLSAVSPGAISFGSGDADPTLLPEMAEMAADVMT